MCVRETSSGFVEGSGLSGAPHCEGELFILESIWAVPKSLSAKWAQKRITDAAAQNIILQFHDRQECDISVCDSDIT